MDNPDNTPTVPIGTTCPKCHQGTMKRSNFRTGSVDKPKADVQVCGKCGHRTEQPPQK